MDDDVPEPDARHAFVGEADPADALLAFEDGIVTMPIERSFSCPSRNDNAAPAEYLGRAALVYALGSKIPSAG